MSKKNYYAILEVSPVSGLSAIKKSYRRLIKLHHPDKNPNRPEAEKKLRAINEAYEILSDTFKRKEYDQNLKEEKQKKQDEANKAKQMYQSFHTYQNFEFNTQAPFANPAAQQEAMQAHIKATEQAKQSLYGTIFISLEEAAKGVKKNFHINSPMSDKKSTFYMEIPSGIKEYQKIKLPTKNKATGQGLYVSVAYKKHEIFTKTNEDILLDLPVCLSQAILGDSIEIPTLYGQVYFDLPGGITSGHIIRLKNLGFPLDTHSNKKGSMLLTLLVDIPSDLKQEELEWFKSLHTKQKHYLKVSEFKNKVNNFLKNRQE